METGFANKSSNFKIVSLSNEGVGIGKEKYDYMKPHLVITNLHPV